ncbi:MAG: NAD(P)/FAD-dependent oxidoreductase, partial [Chloroflexota bacterium]
MIYDVIIVGAGAAGLSAAVYTARGGLKTLVVGDPMKSRVALGRHFDNYLGFPEGIGGVDLMERSAAQARRFGADIRRGEVVGLMPGNLFKVELADGEHFEGKAVILATGVAGKPSGIKGEEELLGQGVSHCVVCDGFFYRDRKVALIGHANYAAREALELLSYTRDVTVFSNGRAFAMDEKLKERLQAEGIAMRNERVVEFTRDESGLTGMLLHGGELFPAEGVFIALGTAGSADFARTLGVELEGNSIVVDRLGRTSYPGI